MSQQDNQTVTVIPERLHGKRVITILYFSALAKRLGLESETITLPEEILSIENLIPWLMTRRGDWQKALAENLIISINRCVVELKQTISNKDEISLALFDEENIN
ncbi:MAG: hypothetical protein KAJ95_06685 [Gammaproteobacteria bacterium]|nr:hypothetical protein [Gammaproteobacteria bacterium]